MTTEAMVGVKKALSEIEAQVAKLLKERDDLEYQLSSERARHEEVIQAMRAKYLVDIRAIEDSHGKDAQELQQRVQKAERGLLEEKLKWVTSTVDPDFDAPQPPPWDPAPWEIDLWEKDVEKLTLVRSGLANDMAWLRFTRRGQYHNAKWLLNFLDIKNKRISILESKLNASAEAFAEERREKEKAQAQLALVKTDRESVWMWQGDGYDHPESLSCPVVMDADTLRELLRTWTCPACKQQCKHPWDNGRGCEKCVQDASEDL